MSRQRWSIGVVLLLVALAALSIRPGGLVSAAPPEERTFLKDGAVRVTRTGSTEAFFLSSPGSVKVGDRGFLYGWKVGGDSALYIPVSEIVMIEEFPTVERMKKVYRLDPAEKPVEQKTATGKK